MPSSRTCWLSPASPAPRLRPRNGWPNGSTCLPPACGGRCDRSLRCCMRPPPAPGHSAIGRPTSRHGRCPRRTAGTSRTKRCRYWSSATWPGSAPHRPPTWRNSPWCSGPGPGARCGRWPARWSSWKGRAAPSSSISPARCGRPRAGRPRPGCCPCGAPWTTASRSPLSGRCLAGLGEEARALTAFLAGRDARAYSRYHHWWAKLPGGEVRILPR
jgi:hypothetical protein